MKSNYLENKQSNQQLLNVHVNEINVLTREIKMLFFTLYFSWHGYKGFLVMRIKTLSKINVKSL